ncbi:MAG: UDP-3-O-acyl-N-acetylglucosamine deacetylase [Alphaproteobacteria bacterium]|jgi:UDP-3-O-[3-hydroxymyristoyl] N-acetylglucosamine deacetylase|nr:UDP-3-O-acyl-N-acetylglucosamine deacetylase [Alphaproteobacteria bacterium]
MALQTTIKNRVVCEGVGVHTGITSTVTLLPAPENTGIIFRRTDHPGMAGVVPARFDRVTDTRLGTTIGNVYGVKVHTVEHLMAAIVGCGVTNLVIEIDAAEVPIMDGSAAPFVFLLECAGVVKQTQAQRAIRVREVVRVEDGDKYAELRPGIGFSAELEIAFENCKVIDRQFYAFDLDTPSFKAELARARTFGFRHEVEYLQKNGHALGGSLANSIVLDGDTIMNEDGLRYADEFVRHKLLDVVGDMSLAGAPLFAQFRGYKTGHALNNKLLRELFARRSAWEYVTLHTRRQTAPVQIERPIYVGGLAAAE